MQPGTLQREVQGIPEACVAPKPLTRPLVQRFTGERQIEAPKAVTRDRIGTTLQNNSFRAVCVHDLIHDLQFDTIRTRIKVGTAAAGGLKFSVL